MSEVTLRLVSMHARPNNTPLHLFSIQTKNNQDPRTFVSGDRLRCGGLKWTITEAQQVDKMVVGLAFEAPALRVYGNYVLRPDEGPLTTAEFDSSLQRLGSIMLQLRQFDAENFIAALNAGVQEGNPMVEHLKPFAVLIAKLKEEQQPDYDLLTDLMASRALANS